MVEGLSRRSAKACLRFSARRGQPVGASQECQVAPLSSRSAKAGARSHSMHSHCVRSVPIARAVPRKCNPVRKRAAVINRHGNGIPVQRVHHRYTRSERQRGCVPNRRSGRSSSAAPRHRRSRLHAAPKEFRGVWSARRTKRSPDYEPARDQPR